MADARYLLNRPDGLTLDSPSQRANSRPMSARGFLVLDIETIIDQGLPVEADPADGFPPPPHHEVVCIGVLWFDAKHQVKRMGIIGEDSPEPAMLDDFAKFLERHQPTCVTFNGRGFDMPVIAARCLKHGLPFRYYYQSRDVRYRFSPDGHLDLMDYVSDFGAAKRTRLDVSARLCGMPGKVGVDGKDVGPLVHAGKLDEVRAYCLCDVLQTAGLFLRVQLLRGELSREHYLEAMRGLMSTALADSRVAPVCQAWDADRLLLGEPLIAESAPSVHKTGDPEHADEADAAHLGA